MSKLWYPSYLIDEVLPEGRATPEAWLTFLLGGDLDEDERVLANSYGPGDGITFTSCEDLGTVELRINPDGSLGAPLRCADTPDMFDGAVEPDRPLPARANSFWEWDSETYAETAEEFAALYMESQGLGEPVEVTVQIARWGEEIAYRISDDGKSLLPSQTSNDVSME